MPFILQNITKKVLYFANVFIDPLIFAKYNVISEDLMFENKLEKIFAFTLAEVLITLAIVGIVAALTIPALLNKTQDLEFKSSFKKVYAQLDQVTRQISNDNNGSVQYAYNQNFVAPYKCGVFTWEVNSNCFRDLYASYLNVMGKCDCNNNGGYYTMNAGVNCWVNERWNNPSSSPGSPSGIYRADQGAGIVLTSGATLAISYYPYGGLTTVPARGIVKIDVNGSSPPNVWGRDYFGAYITDNGLVPFGANGDSWGNVNQQQACNQGGAGCSADVILNK